MISTLYYTTPLILFNEPILSQIYEMKNPTSVIRQGKAHYKTNDGSFMILISYKCVWMHSEATYGIDRYRKQQPVTEKRGYVDKFWKT
jgi:hypothetical protein